MMDLHQPPTVRELRDWLQYWKPSEAPDLPTTPAATNAALNTNEKADSSSSDHLEKLPTLESQPAPKYTSLDDLAVDFPPESERGFPKCAFISLICSPLFFCTQLWDCYHQGLPWFSPPLVFALVAPAMTCGALLTWLQAAPFHWPGLARVEYARNGVRALVVLYFLWATGVWWVVRDWKVKE